MQKFVMCIDFSVFFGNYVNFLGKNVNFFGENIKNCIFANATAVGLRQLLEYNGDFKF